MIRSAVVVEAGPTEAIRCDLCDAVIDVGVPFVSIEGRAHEADDWQTQRVHGWCLPPGPDPQSRWAAERFEELCRERAASARS